MNNEPGAEQVQEQEIETRTVSAEPIKVDHLSEDPPIYGQQFFLMSFAGPQLPQKADILGFKFRGAHRTEEAAREAASKLQKSDPYFDILVGNSGLWLPFFPDPQSIAAKQYQDSKLNELVSDAKDEIERSRDVFADRKREMLERAKFDASRQGQQALAEQKEKWMSVLFRKKDLEAQIRNLQEQLDKTNELAATYTEEEREQAREEYRREYGDDAPLLQN